MNTNDLKIIKQLMNCARTTWAELGTLLHLSAPAVAERVHKLEEAGVIKGYTALIDPEKIGYGLAALVFVTLERPKFRDNFLERMQELDEIQACHHITGEEDYVLKVRCTGTGDLERLISEEIKSLEGVMKTKTMIILSTVKETTMLPVKMKKE